MLSILKAGGPFRRTISFPRRRDGFHVMPTSVGYEIATGPTYDWRGDRRGATPFSVLQHAVAGRGRLRYEMRTLCIEPGETMLVTVPHDHRYWVEPDETWSFFWIAFTGQEALRLHRAILSAAGPVFRLGESTQNTLAEVCLKLGSSVTTAGQASFEAYRATMAVYDEIITHEDVDGAASGHPDIDRVTAFVRGNLSVPIEVAQMSEIAGMSRAHFSRVFKERLGVSPAEFVMRERMERAAKLLADSRLSVKQVSAACGFHDPNYFSKVFRRSFDTSPLEFRTTGMFASNASNLAGP